MWIAGRLGHDLPGNRRKRRMLRYVAGQLTNIIQATAQDKAAQLRQAVRDGWKQYRAKGQRQPGVSNTSSAASQRASPSTREKLIEYVCQWEHAGCTAKPSKARCGVADRADQDRVYCQACGSRFWTREITPKEIAKQAASPWSCSKCSRTLSRDDFSVCQRTQGSAKKCKMCTK